MINLVDLIGRIFISALFLLNGIFKISNYEGTIGWMESFGVPGMFLVPAIILEIVGPILIIVGYKTKLAAGLLSLFCIATAFIFHNDFADQMQFQVLLAQAFPFLRILNILIQLWYCGAHLHSG